MLALGPSFQTVDSWIAAGGYAMLFGLLLACGLGLPLPEDIPLLIAGALVAQGKMDLVVASIAAWCGIIGGDIILYHLGKTLGLEITKVKFIGKHLTQERIQRLEKMFEEYGIGVIAVGRLFMGVRGAMVVAAGAVRFNFIKFIITDGLAALVSGGFFIFVGHWLGSSLTAERRKEFTHWFIIIALVVLLGALAWFFLRRKRDVERVEKGAAKVDQVAGTVAKVTHLAGKPPTQK